MNVSDAATLTFPWLSSRGGNKVALIPADLHRVQWNAVVTSWLPFARYAVQYEFPTKMAFAFATDDRDRRKQGDLSRPKLYALLCRHMSSFASLAHSYLFLSAVTLREMVGKLHQSHSAPNDEDENKGDSQKKLPICLEPMGWTEKLDQSFWPLRSFPLISIPLSKFANCQWCNGAGMHFYDSSPSTPQECSLEQQNYGTEEEAASKCA